MVVVRIFHHAWGVLRSTSTYAGDGCGAYLSSRMGRAALNLDICWCAGVQVAAWVWLWCAGVGVGACVRGRLGASGIFVCTSVGCLQGVPAAELVGVLGWVGVSECACGVPARRGCWGSRGGVLGGYECR